MSEQKKEDRIVWVEIRKTYAGPEGMFAKGETRQMSQLLVQRLKKKISPKTVPNPANANIDLDRVRLSDAQNKLNATQADLNQCRIRQDALLNKKAVADHDLAEMDKLDDKEVAASDVLGPMLRKFKGALEVINADIELNTLDIKEHAAATDKLVAMIEKYRQAIADKNPAPEEMTDEEIDEAKTGSGDGQEKDDADAQG